MVVEDVDVVVDGTEDIEAEEDCSTEAVGPWEHLVCMELRMDAGCWICR